MKKKGFTLIELLVVIAIISLLLAVLMPALKKAKEAGKTISCASNLKQWGMIISFFANDNDDRFPDGDWNNDGPIDPRGMWWMLPLRPYYIGTPDILICTKASRIQDITSSAAWVTDGKYVPENPNECWGMRIMDSTNHPEAGKWVWASIAPNAWIMDPREGFWPNSLPADLPKFWGKFTNIRVPSRVPIFIDCKSVDAWPKDTDKPNSAEYGGTGGQGYMRNVTVLRHNKSVNSVFGDGSVSIIRITELWKLKWHKDFKANNPYTQDDAPWPPWMR